jgi:hypothetical protein
MDDKALQYLWALKRVNEALIDGLETAVYTLEKVEELSKEKRMYAIESLRRLIAQSKGIYEKEPPKE